MCAAFFRSLTCEQLRILLKCVMEEKDTCASETINLLAYKKKSGEIPSSFHFLREIQQLIASHVFFFLSSSDLALFQPVVVLRLRPWGAVVGVKEV